MKKFFFKGVVSHKRVKQKKHGFDYPYRSIFLENIYDFQEKKINHIKSSLFNFSFLKNDDSKEIFNNFHKFIKENNISIENLKINLLKTPDFSFLKTFNPVCFWFLKKNEHSLMMVAEVTNTFHEKQIYYVHDSLNILDGKKWIPIQKKMYVSPFADKQGLYQFKISAEPLDIKINEFDPNGELEILSHLSGQKINFSCRNKLLIFFSIFVNSSLVLARIHLQALFLWLKKVKVFAHNGKGYVD
ncbi:DUF1365 domain-containing protein [SAR86 cluster bacterium]|nr:DUF1365 domain-containing protein [SAR86 cluster bacterium]